MLNNSNNISHATLLIESKLCDLNSFINNYKLSLDVKEDDFILIDGNKEIIKKEFISEIIERFQLSSFNNSKKLYVLLTIENSTKQTLNALLKFLEEPPNDVYAILTCKNIKNVLPTITSRCRQIKLVPDIIKFTSICKQIDLNEKQINVAKTIYYDLNQFENDLKTGDFFSKYLFANELVENKEDIAKIKNLFDNFKKFSYQEIYIVLKIINSIIPTNENLLNLLNTLKYNPNKTLLFNQIWKNINI